MDSKPERCSLAQKDLSVLRNKSWLQFKNGRDFDSYGECSESSVTFATEKKKKTLQGRRLLS